MMMNDKTVPTCTVCGGSGGGYEFPLWPKCPDKKFGTICAECDYERSINLYDGFYA